MAESLLLRKKKRKRNHLTLVRHERRPNRWVCIRSVYNRYLVAGAEIRLRFEGGGERGKRKESEKKTVPRDKLVSLNGSALSREIERTLPMPRQCRARNFINHPITPNR